MEHWVRPVTTRRYLHPPRAERMFTLWAEGKIIFGENTYQEIVGGDGASTYPNLISSGIWPVYSKYVRKFDFRKTENIIQPDGTPVHGWVNRFGGFKMEMEAFCDIDRKPTCFIRIRLTNEAPHKATEQLGLVVRTGKEKQLVSGSPDCYCSHDPEMAAFQAHKPTFREENGVLRDDQVFITSDCPQNTWFDEENGILWCKPALESGESMDWVLSFGKGEAKAFDYAQERAKTLDWWRRELGKLRLPQDIREDREKREMVGHLAAQMLQCVSRYAGQDYCFLRQGGLQRLVWPWDAAPAIEALGRMGEFDDYLEDIFHYYLDLRLKTDGEYDNIGEFWACNTACVLYSFATRCMQSKDRAFWGRYREKAFAAFGWICRKRAESVEGENCFAGLFPPMRSCDWGHSSQFWGTTDLWGIFGIRALAQAAEFFGDDEADRVRREAEEYAAVMKKLLKPFVDGAKNSDRLRIPLTPDGNDRHLLEDFHPYLFHGSFAWSGLLETEDIYKVYNEQVATGMAKNGLYGHMPQRDGNRHIWYTSYTDYYWCRTWLRLGEIRKAEEIIHAQIHYSMTAQYYMIERYCDNDPYYVPWSPNCSASGRLINMLLDLHGCAK